MAAKNCVECGITLSGLKGVLGGKCMECFRVPYAHIKAFFDRKPHTEEDIQAWNLSKSHKTLLGYAIFLFVCIGLGCLLGFANGGTYPGFWYAFIATLVGIVIYRSLMNSSKVHPLTTNRWYTFAFPFSFILFFSWAIAYMAWMPSLAGSLISARSIQSHHVLIAPNLSFPAIYLVTLVEAAAAIIGAAVGYWNTSRQETKIKAHLLTQYQRWQLSTS